MNLLRKQCFIFLVLHKQVRHCSNICTGNFTVGWTSKHFIN